MSTRMPLLDIDSQMDSPHNDKSNSPSEGKQDDNEEETQTGLAETLNVLKQIKSYMNKK